MVSRIETGNLVYSRPDIGIAFYRNPGAGDSAYDIVIKGKDILPIHDRTLRDLTNSGVSYLDMLNGLDAMSNGLAVPILRENEIKASDLQKTLRDLGRLEDARS
ncbi:MAG: hypothetical protein AABW79_01700 [Nanoarchaeota archaeon]